MIPFTDLQSQYKECKKEIDDSIERVLESSSYITGPIVEEVEKSLIEYTGAEACATCGSGTTALQIALKACKIGPSDEVITVSHTFVSTPEAIVNVGATPIFVDIDALYHINLDQIEKSINSRTKAILFVDLYGQTPDIDKLKKIASKNNLYLIEDAAQSFGYKYKDKMVGSLVDITCVSFNPVKNLGAIGDAGCVLGKKDLVDKARMYRDHGRREKFNYEVIGYNARIDNIQALVVQSKLPYLQTWLQKKNEIAKYYTTELRNYYMTPHEASYGKHSYYVYVLQVPIMTDRDEILSKLNDKGIQTNIHYRNPAHMTPAFSEYKKHLARTEYVSEKIFSIPCYHNLKDEQIEYIVKTMKEVL